jgi:hypothetical protein
VNEPYRDTAHLLRVFERLETADLKLAFFELLHRLYCDHWLTFRFLSRGKFSAAHLLFDPDGKPYGDAEFAFKGAKDHMRWWFRPPCFARGLLQPEEIAERLPFVQDRHDEHLITDIRNCHDVDAVMKCVNLARSRHVKA